MTVDVHTSLVKARGFTIVEIMVVVMIIGVMAAMIVPSFVGAKPGLDQDRAKACAVLIATGKDLYLRETGAAGVTAWNAAATSEAKFLLVRSYLGTSTSATLATYLPTGYTVQLGDANQPVTLWEGASEIIFN